jgi:hypothetical protein
VKQVQRQAWGADAVRLRVTLRVPPGREAESDGALESAIGAELAAALRVPQPLVVVHELVRSGYTARLSFELLAGDATAKSDASSRRSSLDGAAVADSAHALQPWEADDVEDDEAASDARLVMAQQRMALHRRVEALAVALAENATQATQTAQATQASLSPGGSPSPNGSAPAAAAMVCGPGVLNLARALSRGSATRYIECSSGLSREDSSGRAVPVLAVHAGTPAGAGRPCAARLACPHVRAALLCTGTLLSDMSAVGLPLIDHLSDFCPTDASLETARVCLADRSEGLTIAGLAKALRGGKAASLGDAYIQYTEFFKVFSDWSFNLESARNRVDACKKLEHFRTALNTCQVREAHAPRRARTFPPCAYVPTVRVRSRRARTFAPCACTSARSHRSHCAWQADPRSEFADILNWLNRPNQHLMRQPMIVENLRDRTRKARPGCTSLAALEVALAKVRVLTHRPTALLPPSSRPPRPHRAAAAPR